MKRHKYSKAEIIAEAESRNIEYDSFCLINFVWEMEDGRLSLADIVDEYEELPTY